MLLRALKRILGSTTTTSGPPISIEVENSGALPVSIYAKTTNPGDTAVTLGQQTAAASMPMVLASDKTVLVSAIIDTLSKTNATGSAAIAASATVGAGTKRRLVSVTVKFSAAPTTSENLTITLNANAGAAYDTVLKSIDPSAPAATSIVYIPEGDVLLEAGDAIDVAYTNTDARTYGVQITLAGV